MLKKTEIALRAARIGALAMVVGVSAGLAGCDDDDNGGGGGSGSVSGNADLSSAKGAQTQAGTLLLMTQIIDGIENGQLIDAGTAKAAENCDDGGTVEETAAANQDVKSPYDKNVDVEGTTFTDCRSISEGEGGSLTMVLSGVSEGGESSTDSPEVSYFRLGKGAASSTTPFTYGFKLDNGSSGLDATYGFFYRADAKRNADGSGEEQLVLDMNVKFKPFTSGAPAGSIPDITFKSFFGSTAAPFTTAFSSEGVTVNGSYGAEISTPHGADTGCSNGKVTVKTVVTLVQANTAQVSPFTAGELELESGGKKAKVVFVGDKIKVTPDGGTESDLLDPATLGAAASGCAGLALSGLALAGAAAR